jgi:hypothetical protein
MVWQFILAMSIPSAITGLLVWWLKRYIEKKDREREEHEKNTEKFMLMIVRNGTAAYVLAEATAKAVQRIPDAHCNGDMTAALEQAARIHKEESDFIMDQGIKHIYED